MRKVEINDLYRFRFVSGPQWSPEGTKAFFTVTMAKEETNDYESDLWLLEDGKTRRLTTSRDVRTALWLDEDSLMFASARDPRTKEALKKKEQLTVFYRLDLNGGEAQECMRLPLTVLDIKKMEGGFAVLAKYDMREKRDDAYEVFEEIPFWMDGKGFTDGLRSRLYLVKDGKPEPVTGENEQVGGFAVCGGSVIYSSHCYDKVFSPCAGITLLENGEKKALVPDGTWQVSWVNFLDGQPVASMTDGKLHGIGEIPKVYSLDENGPVRLFEKDEVAGSGVGGDSTYGGGARTAFDGKAMYYLTACDLKTALRKFENGALATVCEVKGSIDSITVKNGRILAACTAEDRLSELYEIKNGEFVRLTGFNDELAEETEIPLPEPLSVMNDGWQINGAVIKPAGFEEGKTYPAILEIHGGPFGAYGTPYHHEMQMLAAKGYFVFYCNPRGGDGRGSDFAELRGKLGTIDYSDIMAFTDKVLETYPMIDKNRLGVTGGSYGGYMTNWIIGHTDRFAAAVSCRSISNWLAQNLYTDIGLGYGEEIVQGDVWRDPQVVRDQSPIEFANKAKTPTLFIHSDRDFRCYMGEGLQMYTALQKFGVPTRFVLFHGESHGLSRGGKPKNRITRLTEIADWMDKYLK
ncbi:MAG: S9 family peptidase [Firmicutes bacterium]|nr:S9 family peptidase [Bacillota bacterium]